MDDDNPIWRVILSHPCKPFLNLETLSSHVRFSPNSRFVLASTQDSTIRLWNYQTSRCVKTYTGHVNRTYCIPACFITSKGKYIVSGSEDNKLYIWDLQTRQVHQTLEGHRGMILAYHIDSALNAFQDVVLAVAVSLKNLAGLSIPQAHKYSLRHTHSEISLHQRQWRKT